MTKLEELSEMLVSEINDFEKTVKRLDEIRKNKIQLDISELQIAMNRHEKILVTSRSETEKQIDRMKVTIGKAKIYPKWAVVIFIISLFLNFIGLVAFLFLNKVGEM